MLKLCIKCLNRIFLLVLLLMSAKAYGQFSFETEKSKLWADSVLATLTVDEKIGQLFMIYVETTWDGNNLAFYKKQLQDKCPGGLILFKGGPTKARKFVAESQKLAKIPLLIGVDGEFGLSMRMDTFPSVPASSGRAEPSVSWCCATWRAVARSPPGCRWLE